MCDVPRWLLSHPSLYFYNMPRAKPRPAQWSPQPTILHKRTTGIRKKLSILSFSVHRPFLSAFYNSQSVLKGRSAQYVHLSEDEHRSHRFPLCGFWKAQAIYECVVTPCNSYLISSCPFFGCGMGLCSRRISSVP